MTPPDSLAFLFDDVRVEPATFRAFKAGNPIQLEPKAFRLLLFLIENRVRLVEKGEILESVWNGTHVTENALVRAIAKLRQTLGDDPKTPKYIETVPTRGYRFIAEVEVRNASEDLAESLFKPNEKDSSETAATVSSGMPQVHSPHTSWAKRLAVAGILVVLATAAWLAWKAQKGSRSVASTVPL